ncbi:MAG TPA: hypothetical protein VG871_13120, partial [Vicinamibacterales bacterium]|nr:hypothetical protein [Vicinamibacterales bacterium]
MKECTIDDADDGRAQPNGDGEPRDRDAEQARLTTKQTKSKDDVLTHVSSSAASGLRRNHELVGQTMG